MIFLNRSGVVHGQDFWLFIGVLVILPISVLIVIIVLVKVKGKKKRKTPITSADVSIDKLI